MSRPYRLSTKFNMPNLTSVERLARFYEDDKNHFVLLMVAYDIEGILRSNRQRHICSHQVPRLGPPDDWCAGWGQIQIANSNRITVNPGYSRKKWMIELCDALLEFYPKEIAKIDKRIVRFQKIRFLWAKRAEP